MFVEFSENELDKLATVFILDAYSKFINVFEECGNSDKFANVAITTITDCIDKWLYFGKYETCLESSYAYKYELFIKLQLRVELMKQQLTYLDSDLIIKTNPILGRMLPDQFSDAHPIDFIKYLNKAMTFKRLNLTHEIDQIEH